MAQGNVRQEVLVSDLSIEWYQDAPPPSQTLEVLEKRAEGYFRSARVLNTVKAYRYNLEHFATWCRVEAGRLSPFSAEPRTVSLYITDLAGRGTAGEPGFRASTLQRRLAAIAQLHQEAGLNDPTKTKAVRHLPRVSARDRYLPGGQGTNGRPQRQARGATSSPLSRPVSTSSSGASRPLRATDPTQVTRNRPCPCKDTVPVGRSRPGRDGRGHGGQG